MPQLTEDALNWESKPLPITGDDIMDALNLKPGPRVGEVLREVEDWWLLEGRKPDKQACLEQAKKLG